MYDVIAAQGDEDDYGYPVPELGAHLVTGDALPSWSVRAAHELGEDTSGGDEPSNQDLLAEALQDAMDAHDAGLIVGPGVDEVALRRARRRALRAETAHVLRTRASGGAA